ncbi:MAG: hypothetical protein E5Y83_12725 [Mesorhizobium sp.]|nr:MAG: hypothetical protein E5Y83_12725 [Mesorhizobium sp.]
MRDSSALRRPPLSCRTSSPQGGRLAVTRGGDLFCNAENWRNPTRNPISPQVGEMSGRTEGGAVPPNCLSFAPAKRHGASA